MLPVQIPEAVFAQPIQHEAQPGPVPVRAVAFAVEQPFHRLGDEEDVAGRNELIQEDPGPGLKA